MVGGDILIVEQRKKKESKSGRVLSVLQTAKSNKQNTYERKNVKSP